ncbi:MAG: metal ABC transporter substrate-binding protein [Candidatus Omnitrophota bacterium]
MGNPRIFILPPFIILAVQLFFICPSAVSEADTGTVDVVASFYPMYIMAINVCKDVPGVTVTNLTPSASGCLHDYSITTDDMKRLEGAEIFVANGAGMEPFMDKVISRYPSMKTVRLADGIPLIRDQGGEEDNPHLWVSISDAMLQVKSLGKAMETFDPGHKELYRSNTDGYLAKLDALRSRMQSELAPFRGRKIVTFHEAFRYFAGEFGLEIAAVVEREPGSAPGSKELAETIDLIKENGVKVLFSEPQYPASAADTIARETGATVYMLDPAVTGPDDPDAYLNIMEENLATLKKALS